MRDVANKMIGVVARNWLLLAGVVLVLPNFIYSAYSHRFLAYDGAYWIYRVFEQDRIYYDMHRFFTTLWQWPSVWLMRFGGEPFFELALAIMSFLYSFSPLLSLLFCFLYLKKKKKLEWIFLPCFSLAGISLISATFTVAVIHDMVAVLWPFLFLLMFRDKGNSWEGALLVLFGGLLYGTYEPALLIYLAAIAVTYDRGRREPFDFWDVGTLLISLLGAYSWSFLLLTIPGSEYHGFWFSFRSGFGANAYIAMYIVGAIVAYLVLPLPRWLKLLLLATAIFFSVRMFILAAPALFDLTSGRHTRAYANRVIGTGLALMLAASALFLYFRRLNLREFLLAKDRAVLHVAFLLLLAASAVFDAREIYGWNRAKGVLLQKMSEGKACQILDPKDINPVFEGGITDWAITPTSVLLQKTYRPAEVIFVRAQVNQIPEDICEEMKKGRYGISSGLILYMDGTQKFKFGRVRQALEEIKTEGS